MFIVNTIRQKLNLAVFMDDMHLFVYYRSGAERTDIKTNGESPGLQGLCATRSVFEDKKRNEKKVKT